MRFYRLVVLVIMHSYFYKSSQFKRLCRHRLYIVTSIKKIALKIFWNSSKLLKLWKILKIPCHSWNFINKYKSRYIKISVNQRFLIFFNLWFWKIFSHHYEIMKMNLWKINSCDICKAEVIKKYLKILNLLKLYMKDIGQFLLYLHLSRLKYLDAYSTHLINYMIL